MGTQVEKNIENRYANGYSNGFGKRNNIGGNADPCIITGVLVTLIATSYYLIILSL